jgi:ribonuclease P protein component
MEVRVKRVATLKKNYEFSRVFNKGLFYVGRHIVVYAFPNRQSINRIGISVSKKAGKAVIRNKKKRLIREVYRHYEDFILKGYDIVIAARGGETVFKYSELLKEFKYLLKKLQIFDQEKHNCLKEL